MTWQVATADTDRVQALLEDGWEPFGAQDVAGRGGLRHVRWFLRRRTPQPQPQAVKGPETLPTLTGGVERPRWDDE